ncbi:hypothetical protein D4R52_03535 [bacterium]|nr:MAG: hypothetical protein D4R52_03535 [bacterium]
MISLKSQVTIRILDYYYLNPSARHYINELARILKLDPKNLHRKLNELEKEGILKSDFAGKERYYYLNGKSRVAKAYKDLFLQTVGLPEQLKKLIKSVNGTEQAYIFGSYAKNTMSAGSDIDLLVVGNHSVLDLQKELNQLQKWIGREINAVNLTKKELKRKEKNNDPFISNIFSNKHLKLL